MSNLLFYFLKILNIKLRRGSLSFTDIQSKSVSSVRESNSYVNFCMELLPKIFFDSNAMLFVSLENKMVPEVANCGT